MIFSVEPEYIVSAVCKARMSVHQEIQRKMTAGTPMLFGGVGDPGIVETRPEWAHIL
jgi:hypothetical protein